MNKADLIEALQNKAGILKNEAETAVNLFINEISKALATGDRAEIRGLCSFCVKNYRAYTGKNPKTGEHVKVKAKKLPFFKCGKELKERVDC